MIQKLVLSKAFALPMTLIVICFPVLPVILSPQISEGLMPEKVSTYGNPKFPQGTRVKVVDRKRLIDFSATWNKHHPLQSEQLEYADRVAIVKSIGWYFGGDPVYSLEGLPGSWLDPCLESADSASD